MAANSQRSAASAVQKPVSRTASQAAPEANTSEAPVNRKKQKRRQKQAAKIAAEQSASNSSTGGVHGHKQNGHAPSPITAYGQHGKLPSGQGDLDYGPSDLDDHYESRDEELFYSEEESHFVDAAPAHGLNEKSKKKKKNKSRTESQPEYHNMYSPQSMPGSFHPPPPPPPPPPLNSAAIHSAHSVTRDRIWNTSTAEERERIKEFWLSLEETQRRSLVKVEKEAVLKKMKEQQRNSCSCTVCGRKRTAIEEELEVLYDAYYEELEQYANHQQIDGTIMPPPGSYPPLPRQRAQQNPHLHSHMISKGRITEEIEEEDDGDDEGYSGEDDSEDEEYYDDEPKGPATDFFNFGNSLTVQGGILTVADDLLKNDGKKFIEMMEQLAERRMAREKAHGSRYDPPLMRHPSLQSHNHDPPADDEDEFEDEDGEYEDSQDDDYDEDMEAMSEEQRMEEGRRMFQIFAARMFEQRVLTAYREKVAKERQEKLLEELADESRLDQEREAKKAKEAQKKKDKKKQQKMVKEEERQKREAEKAAEEAAAKAVEERKLEEQRLRKEEQRRKKEMEKKAQEEERLRKEAEKQRKLQEVRDQQAETERRQREQKEKEKKKKDEAKRREKEERDAKEKEAKDRREKEALERRERDVKLKAERDARERAKQAPQPVPVPTLLRKPSSIAPSVPPGLQTSLSNHASPHLAVATPVIPKAPAPAKPRQPSHQSSHHSSPKSAQIVSESFASSPGSSMPPPMASIVLPTAKLPNPTPTHHQIPVSILPIAPPPGMQPYPLGVMANSTGMPLGPSHPANYAQAGPGILSRGTGHDASMYNHQQFSGPPHRGFASPNGLGFPPGINGMRHMPQGRGSPVEVPSTQAPIGSGSTVTWMPSHSQNHSRQTSASFDKTSFDLPGTISRPAPIQRPSIMSHQGDDHDKDVDDLSSHLGSSALLDDTDDGPELNLNDLRSMGPGGNRPNRLGFGSSPMFSDPLSSKMENFPPRTMQGGNKWGTPQLPIGTPTMPNPSNWSMAPGSGWSNSNNSFGHIGGSNRPSSRPVTLRLLAAQACKHLSASNLVKQSGGFHHLDNVIRMVEQLRPASEPPIHQRELLEILDTEGNAQNGGGSFVFQDLSHGTFVRFDAETASAVRGMGPPGEIGSPVGTAAMPFGRGIPHGGIPAPSGF